MRWAAEDGDHSLAKGPCANSGAGPHTLLEEDGDKDGNVVLCVRDMLWTMSGGGSVTAADFRVASALVWRRCRACCFAKGMLRLGDLVQGGVLLRRGPRLYLEVTIMKNLNFMLGWMVDEVLDLRRLLDDARGEDARVTKPRLRSPGNTPKSSIQRNLAKLGLLDSPSQPAAVPILEDFFQQYAEGRDLGLSEEEVRQNLAIERGRTL